MSWRRSGWDAEAYETFIVGEQIRCQMHAQGLVRDRRYHLRKYRNCFIGRDTVDWLVKLYHVSSRDEGVEAMNVLQKYGLIHHVADEHDFKDSHLFYRWTHDDQTYKVHRELRAFYKGVDLYRRLKTELGSVMREYYNKGISYKESFFGCDLLDFVCVTGADRSDALKELRQLLERDILKHVTDDYHFTDDRLIYEFALDFNKPCILMDVLCPDRQKNYDIDFPSSTDEREEIASYTSSDTSVQVVKSSKRSRITPRDSIKSTTSSISSMNSMADSMTSAYDLGMDSLSSTSITPKKGPKSVSKRPVVIPAVNDPNAPYFTRHIQMSRDAEGFGLTLHGNSPCKVKTVDPMGPAAAAGLRVRQFVTHVNGQEVLQEDHKHVGLMIASRADVTLTVIMDRGDAKRSDI